MNFETYYKELNEKNGGLFATTLEKVKEIKEKISRCGDCKYEKFIEHTADMIVSLCEHEGEINDEYFEKKSFDELLEKNHELYKNLAGEAYETSYANPEYCAEIFGVEIGRSISFLYMIYVKYIEYAYKHKRFEMAKYNQLFIDVVDILKGENEWTAEELRVLVTRERMGVEGLVLLFKEDLDPEASGFMEFVKNGDLMDLRYLFRYGKYITENEIKTAEFYNKYDEKKTDKIAETFTEAFKNSFIRNNKDMSIKKNVELLLRVGQEQMIRRAVKKFKDMGLECTLNKIYSTEPSKQMKYDHRFDNGLYLNEEIGEEMIERDRIGIEKVSELLKGLAGLAYVEKFGDKPFVPKNKDACIKYDEKQQALFNKFVGAQQQEIAKYAPASEYGFTVIAFPIPDIGENFEEIFEDTCELNMLESSKYEVIQQKIIDALDKGEFVHVKGKGTNRTDIMVKNQKINDPEKETNYLNCVADINIPVGEVFTSPELKGTNGILHVEKTYLMGLKYENLEIKFKDGYMEEYSCSNFDNEEDNKKYIEENLIFPNKTLPLGEFAIGTNTTAYVMANKHQILDIMPILIVEKMGPHFAIGDTCFSWAEDNPVYNPLDGKEIIARDNDKSRLRKKNIEEAYTQCHTDITIPYSGLEFIKAITSEGEEIEIIRDERFVLPGTEELNEAFDK